MLPFDVGCCQDFGKTRTTNTLMEKNIISLISSLDLVLVRGDKVYQSAVKSNKSSETTTAFMLWRPLDLNMDLMSS